MGIVTLVKNCMRWTQAVIVAPLIARAKSHWMQALWTLIFVGTTIAFLVTSYYMIVDHLAHKKTTSIRLFYEPETPFPAVTFCNLNAFKKSMLHHSVELTNLEAAYTYMSKMKQARMANGLSAVATTTSDRTENGARRKRQADDKGGAGSDTVKTVCQKTYNAGYNVTACSNGTVLVDFAACEADNLLKSKSFTLQNVTRWNGDMARDLYKCFNSFCTSASLQTKISPSSNTLGITAGPPTSPTHPSDTKTVDLTTTSAVEAITTEQRTTTDESVAQRSVPLASCELYQNGLNALRAEPTCRALEEHTDQFYEAIVAQSRANLCNCALVDTVPAAEAPNPPATPQETMSPSNSTLQTTPATLTSGTEAAVATTKPDTRTWTDHDYFHEDKRNYDDYGRARDNHVGAADKHSEEVDHNNGYYSGCGGHYRNSLDKYGCSNGDLDGRDGDNSGGTCGYVTYHGDFYHIERINYEYYKRDGIDDYRRRNLYDDFNVCGGDSSHATRDYRLIQSSSNEYRVDSNFGNFIVIFDLVGCYDVGERYSYV